ncbi:hypothetical protein [Bradyrhizobium sp. WD16]|uniref:hypothetical protein n=1 Tax=Bradyrhizobium sp. WD16 TaxID=1521768 RepID=UPI0020A278FD|nr:hypothetical protein [Bradyrhizobium sp. WD16]UTD26557.1 hypothetical protein DB459_06095 [Bradyrhizobium sp. WD16]
MPAFPERPSLQAAIATALVCVNAALLGLGWVMSERGASRDSFESGAAPSRMATGITPSAPVKRSLSVQEDPILMRPIFFPSRKPFEPPVMAKPPAPAPVASAPPAKPQFILDGVVLAGNLRHAHVRKPSDGAGGRWLDVGKSYDEWTLVDVLPHEARFERNGLRAALRLYPSQTNLQTLEQQR